MRRILVLLVLAAALTLPLAAAHGGSTTKSTPAPAVQIDKPVGAHGGGDCPYASIDASV